MGDLALSFAGGLFTGLAIAAVFWLFRPRRLMMMTPAPGVSLPAPAVLSTACANGVLTVTCNIGAAPAGLKLCGVYVAVYDNQPTAVPSDPTGVAGVVRFNPGAALNYTLPAGLNGPTDWVVVWAEYCGTSPSAAFSYNTCPAVQQKPGPVIDTGA
jgi:hypothetical protein